MKKRAVGCILTCFFLLAVAVLGSPINVRPVTVNPATDGPNLQTILNSIYGCSGCVNAFSDQSAAAKWELPEVPPATIELEIAATSALVGVPGDAIGIYTDNNLVDVFGANAATGDTASLTFNADGTLTIAGADCTTVNCATFSGINQDGFGFYLVTGNSGFFTEDSKNGGTARALTYVSAPTDLWSIAFEDGADFDYNDRVITAQSLTSVPEVPEPTSFTLLGTGLLGLVRLRKKY